MQRGIRKGQNLFPASAANLSSPSFHPTQTAVRQGGLAAAGVGNAAIQEE